jgi:hypothetical protein
MSTTQTNVELLLVPETCDIADQGCDVKLTHIPTTTSLDDFSDESTLGKQSDLEGGLSKLQLEG